MREFFKEACLIYIGKIAWGAKRNNRSAKLAMKIYQGEIYRNRREGIERTNYGFYRSMYEILGLIKDVCRQEGIRPPKDLERRLRLAKLLLIEGSLEDTYK